MDIQKYRDRQLRELTNDIGVYALCDLDNVPIYVGQSKDGIRKRVRRHLTSARSDVIANRQLDVWEIAYVIGWPMPGALAADIGLLEAHLIGEFHRKKPLVNGSLPVAPSEAPTIPIPQVVQVMPDDEIQLRKLATLRLPRQLSHFQSLFEHILEVKDNVDQRRALAAHFDRLNSYYLDFLKTQPKKQPDDAIND